MNCNNLPEVVKQKLLSPGHYYKLKLFFIIIVSYSKDVDSIFNFLTHDDDFSFGQLIPQFRMSDFPLTRNENQLYVALVNCPLTPPPPPPPPRRYTLAVCGL